MSTTKVLTSGSISLDDQVAGIQKILADISGRDVVLAYDSAILKTLSAARTESVRALSRSIKVPQKYFRKSRVFISSRKQVYRTHYGQITIRSKPISGFSLLKEAQKTGLDKRLAGTQNRVRIAGRTIKPAFVNTTRFGNRQLFTRSGGREPYEHISFPIEDAVKTAGRRAIERAVDSNFKKKLKQALIQKLRKYGAT